MASMASGSEHARRTAKLGDAFEVMLAYSHIVGGMRGLRQQDFELHPCTSASLLFVDTTDGDMHRNLAQHARIVARDVRASKCTAEGPGIQRAVKGFPATLTVRVMDCQGQPCSDGGDAVRVRLMGVRERGREGDGTMDLATQVGVVDTGDGPMSAPIPWPRTLRSRQRDWRCW